MKSSFLFFLLLTISSCDFGTRVVNKISGHDECCEKDPLVQVYHEESETTTSEKPEHA